MSAEQTVTLRNGKTVPKSTVDIVLIISKAVSKTDPIAFQQLVMLARFPQHRLNGSIRDVLNSYDLLKEGELTDVIRDIVLAATDGDNLEDVRLVDPFPPSSRP